MNGLLLADKEVYLCPSNHCRFHQFQKKWLVWSKESLAVLNSCVLALFDFWGVTNAKEHMRRLEAQPLQAVRLLLTALKEN